VADPQPAQGKKSIGQTQAFSRGGAVLAFHRPAALGAEARLLGKNPAPHQLNSAPSISAIG